MSESQFLTIIQSVLILILQLSSPILIVSVVVGLLISIFQSVTQIQESTLTFVPKIIAGILTLIILMPWMLSTYTSE
jgi:flagellar biosynthetic protein FliQ